MLSLQRSRYDPVVQMYVEPPREPRLEYLCFLRWLAERGRLEHEPVGPPTGVYAHRLRAVSPFARAYPGWLEGRKLPEGPIPLPSRGDGR